MEDLTQRMFPPSIIFNAETVPHPSRVKDNSWLLGQATLWWDPIAKKISYKSTLKGCSRFFLRFWTTS